MRIAILQRDPVQRAQIERVLGQCGHACMPFSDGISLAKALAASTVDMLVLDWQGTRLSGAELLKTVRAINGNQIPVLFASEDTSDDSVLRAFSVGADDYVSLPVCPSVFRARVNALLRRAFPDRFDNVTLDAGAYRFDMRRRPESLDWRGAFNICLTGVQYSTCSTDFHLQWLDVARVRVQVGAGVAHVAEQRLGVDVSLVEVEAFRQTPDLVKRRRVAVWNSGEPARVGELFRDRFQLDRAALWCRRIAANVVDQVFADHAARAAARDHVFKRHTDRVHAQFVRYREAHAGFLSRQYGDVALAKRSLPASDGRSILS
ncbi:MAG: response regulator [Paraburkholderia tropica]|nr:response regulator [Paraburkholderia tropica]